MQEKDRHRINLLDVFPPVREFLRSGIYPAGLNRVLTPYAYPLLLALLFFGPQDRAHNLGLNAVWCWWWPGIFLLYPLVGRWWCSGELDGVGADCNRLPAVAAVPAHAQMPADHLAAARAAACSLPVHGDR